MDMFIIHKAVILEIQSSPFRPAVPVLKRGLNKNGLQLWSLLYNDDAMGPFSAA